MISGIISLDGLLILNSFKKARITCRQSEEVRNTASNFSTEYNCGDGFSGGSQKGEGSYPVPDLTSAQFFQGKQMINT
jgi:hypothetical protein